MAAELNFQAIPLAEVPMPGLQFDTEPERPIVLVVDDEQIIADTRAAILTRWGYTVMKAYDAEAALELARLNPPKVLVTDVILNQINGAELARVIQSRSSDCHVILLTGLAEADALIAEARASGCRFTLLQKPVLPQHLRAYLPQINGR